MICVLVGFDIDNDDDNKDAAWGRIQQRLKEAVVTTTTTTTTEDYDDDDEFMEWRDYSVVEQEDGTTILLATAIASNEALVTTHLGAFLEQGQCEIWATAPAPLPLPPSNGYHFVLEKDDDNEIRRGAQLMSDWGMLVQTQVLDVMALTEFRTTANQAMEQAESLLALHRPSLQVGIDPFVFSEMASRSQQRFDLRLTGDDAHDLVRRHL